MLGSSEERDRFRGEVIKELKGRLEEVGKLIDPSRRRVKLVGVVGSFARGDWHAGSDIDVLLVYEGASGPPWKRLDLPPIIVRGHWVEFHVLSPEEFELLCVDARMPAYDLFNEGLIIYADKSYLERVKRLFDEASGRMKVARRGSFLIRENV